METILRDHIKRLTDAYLPAGGFQLSTVSQRAAGDWRWLGHVLNGGNFSVRKFDQAVTWLSDHWPEGAVWPADVPRPAPSPSLLAEPAASTSPAPSEAA